MKWLFTIFLIICIVFSVFAFDTYKVTDFADVENAKFDRYVTVAYDNVEQRHNYNLITFPFYQYPNNGGTLYSQIYQFMFVSDRYIYRLRFNVRQDLIEDYYIPYFDRKSLIIELDLSSIVIDVLYYKSDLGVYKLASGSFDEGSDPVASYLSEGYQYITVSSLGEFVSSSNGLLDAELQKAYNYINNYMDLAFLYNRTTELSSSDYNNLAPSFYKNFDLVDLTPSNGFQFAKNIVFEVDQVGPAPQLPDPENVDGPLEFIGDYFMWVVREIVYLFKIAGAFLRGVVL